MHQYQRRVIWIFVSNVQQYRWRCTSRCRRQRPLLLLQNLLTASKDPHNSVSGCCCSLLVPINVLKDPDANFYQSKSLSQLQNHHGPLHRLRLSFLSFFKGALLPNVNRMVKRELLIMAVQHITDMFSIEHYYLRAWFVSGGKLRKSGNCCIIE